MSYTQLEALHDSKRRGMVLHEFWGMKEPVCPHCAAVYVIEDHDAWRMYEEGEHDATCGTCELDFKVTTRVKYSFSTEDQEKEA